MLSYANNSTQPLKEYLFVPHSPTQIYAYPSYPQQINTYLSYLGNQPSTHINEEVMPQKHEAEILGGNLCLCKHLQLHLCSI